MISAGLQVNIPWNSSVLELTFVHPNPAIVQPVLATIIDTYLKRHLEIHRPGATFDDAFVQQTDQLKARLSQTEQELLRARNSVGITSLGDARKTSAERINQFRNGIMQAEAEIAERKAMLKRLAEASGTAPAAPTEGESTQPINVANLPLAEYQSLIERYRLFRTRQQEMMLLFTAESPRIQAITAQVADLLAQKTALEKAHPGLIQVAPAMASAQRSSVAGGTIDPMIESARIAALETRVEIFKLQLQQVRDEASAVDRVEVNIQDLERRKTLEETNYSYFAATIEQSRINQALGAGRVTNINQVQTPSPPSLLASKSRQYAMSSAAGGLALGILWAFLVELFLDRSIKRPVDVRRHLGLNLFLSIPYLKNRRRLRVADPNAPLLAAGEKAPDLPHGCLLYTSPSPRD